MKDIATKPKKILIVAGEASGDMHAAGLVHHLRQLLPDVQSIGIGGSYLEDEGVHLIYRSEELAVMGFSEVLTKLGRIYRIYRAMVSLIKNEKLDAVLLVDLPDFNLRLAKKASRANIPVFYYISPQLWAWRKKRIKLIKKYIRKMIVIFPFEEDFYRKHGVDVHFSGYPLCEKLNSQTYLENYDDSTIGAGQNNFLIGLLPGSRNSEIKRILPPLLACAELCLKENHNISFVLPRASTVDPLLLTELIAQYDVPVKVVDKKTYEVMANADLLLIASGTATVEATCLTTPMIVVYKVSPLSYQIARSLIRIPFIAMPNLIAGTGVVPEFVQKSCSAELIYQEMKPLLQSPDKLEAMRAKIAQIRLKLQGKNAYRNAAEAVYNGLLE